MANYRKPGVCGMNPVPSTAGNTDNLFYGRSSCSPGPVCSVLNPKVINISVFNNYDTSEGIDCHLEVYNNDILVVSRIINKSQSLSYKVEIPDSKKVANYTITIYSPTKHGKKVSKECLGIESGISKSIVVFSNSSAGIRIGISRRESILHDFLMRFNVSKNASVKGEAPFYELESMSDVAKHSAIITSEASKWGVDSNLVKAIMYMETTHGYYDALPALIDRNKSILPMNVRSDYWKDIGFTREELKKIKHNITAALFLIKKLTERVNPYSIEGLASLYQDLGTTKVTEYGARVKKIYDGKLWIPKPGLLKKIDMEINRFERLSPMEQIKILERLFGGRY